MRLRLTGMAGRFKVARGYGKWIPFMSSLFVRS